MLRKKYKAFALSLVSVLVATSMLTGCGSGKSAGEKADKNSNESQEDASLSESADTNGGAYDSESFFPFGEAFYDGRWYSGELTEPEKEVSAEEIYAKISYTPQMFYGDYRLNHPSDGVQTAYASKRFLNNCKWVDGYEVSSKVINGKISTIPYRIVAGNAELDNPLITDTSYNWCQLYFAANNDENTGVCIDAAYTVEGHTITFTPVADWSFNEETAELTYKFEDTSLSYDFEFKGPRLTLSTEDASYTLIERDFTSWRSYVTEENVSVESSLSEKSRKIGRITGIDMTVQLSEDGSLNTKKSGFSLKVDEGGHTKSYNGIAKWDEDGLFTFSYEDKDGETQSYSMVMFYCGFDGIVLSDGSRNYYYLSTFLSEASFNHYTIEDLGANVSEEDVAVLENLTEEEIAEIFETRENLLEDFDIAFNDNGIEADIDVETGEIVLDSSILFSTGQSDLSDEGKEALKAFIAAFASVISDEQYEGFISSVEVQGHTDTDGNYDFNLELSRQRAEKVKAYCIEEAGLSGELKSKMKEMLIPKGYSYDHPVYFPDGTVDMDSSRRVEFVFYINITGN